MTAASPTNAPSPASQPGLRRWFVALWTLAIGTRVLQLLTESAYLHPDALHQGLEPAFRALNGYGEIAWEFQRGLRSWAFPGLLAGPMALTQALGLSGPGVGMALGVAASRAVMVAIDLWALHETSRYAEAKAGRAAALVVMFLGAAHPMFVVMGAQPLIDVPAAALLIALVRRCEREDVSVRAAVMIGALAALTALVRVQLAPAVLVAVTGALLLRRPPASSWGWGALGALGVLGAWALLDWWTWGRLLHSLRAYLAYNLSEGQTAFGVMPPSHYLTNWGQVAPVFAWVSAPFAVLAARKNPLLAATLIAVVLPHQLVPYKVWRFLHPALWLWLALVAVGWSHLRVRRAVKTALAVCVLVGACASWVSQGVWQTTWLHHQGGAEAVGLSRALNRAYLAVSAGPAPQKVAQAVVPQAAAPGAALLGHSCGALHPLGQRVPPAELRAVDLWILRDDGKALRTWPRVWRDPATDVAVLRRPK